MTVATPRESAWLRRTCGLKLASGATLALGAAVCATQAEAGAFATARYTGEADSFHVAGSYTHIHCLQRDNTGKSIQTEPQGASRKPDAGGVYRSWVGVFNANAEITF